MHLSRRIASEDTRETVGNTRASAESGGTLRLAARTGVAVRQPRVRPIQGADPSSAREPEPPVGVEEGSPRFWSSTRLHLGSLALMYITLATAYNLLVPLYEAPD